MKKIFNIIFIGIGLAATSCSELPEYELPYELSPTTNGSVSVSSSPSNSLCPGPAATFTVESEGSVLYVVQPAEDEAPTSKEIWENEDAGEVTFAEAGSQVIDLDFDENGLVMGEEFTIYTVTINENGIRQEAVKSQNFTVSTVQEIIEASYVTDYTATTSFNGNPFSQLELEFVREGNSFVVTNLWGDFVAAATGDPSYVGQFPYPATITVNEDFTVVVEGGAAYALGGSGTYDPCTGEFAIDFENAIFNPPADALTVSIVPTTTTETEE